MVCCSMVSDQREDLCQLAGKAVNFCLPLIQHFPPPSSHLIKQLWIICSSYLDSLNPSLTQNHPPSKSVFCAVAMKTARWSGKQSNRLFFYTSCKVSMPKNWNQIVERCNCELQHPYIISIVKFHKILWHCSGYHRSEAILFSYKLVMRNHYDLPFWIS